MRTDKPKIIVISGAPGSGKSTLAKKLTEYIQFIYIDADAVLQNIWLNNTTNKDYDRELVGLPMLFDLIVQLGKVNGLNIILDASPSNEIDQKKLVDVFEVKHIHCEAINTVERFYRRELNDNGEEPDWLSPHMKVLEEQKEANSVVPDLNVPVIRVSTDSDYKPAPKTIIEELNIADGYKLWGKPNSL